MSRQSNRSVCRQAGMLLLPVLLLLLLPALAGAEWYKDYESAMDMLKKGQNAEAIPRLQAAVAQKGEEGTNIKFYGMKFGDYFPHYYLGMAYFSQKNYDAAVREFEISERGGAIQKKRDLYDKMSSVRTLARAQLSIQKEPVVATNQPPVTIPVNPPPTEVKPQEKPAEPIKELQQQQKPADTTASQNTQKPQQEKPLDTKPPVTPPTTIDVDAETVKVMVRNGARKYFEGDYDGAISYLTSAVEVNPREPSAHFLLGCSYASKYLLGGSENKAFLQNASTAFQKLKKINPAYQPKNKTYFSPAVLDVYTKS